VGFMVYMAERIISSRSETVTEDLCDGTGHHDGAQDSVLIVR
jgi:hypothetical protein